MGLTLKNKKAELLDYAVYILIGVVLFLFIYGTLPLRVTYDHWILNGYYCTDITAHYAGWFALRNSAWHMPLGMTDYMGNIRVTYTDSIPLVSIFLKLFDPVLPETFQFFGWYVLLSFILQSISSGITVKLITGKRVVSYISSVLFVLAPVMIDKAFMHTALCSHYIILFSIYLYFTSKKKEQIDYRYILLGIIAMGIHPYFLPVVFPLMFFLLIELRHVEEKKREKNLIVVFLSIVLTVGFGFLIGALSATHKAAGSQGYGLFTLDLNGAINPASRTVGTYSSILPVLPITEESLDACNYLGLGGIVVFLIGLGVLIYKKELWTVIKKNYGLMIYCVVFLLFAISNNIWLNGVSIVTLPFPGLFYKVATVFRAGTRFFSVVYYPMFLVGIYGISKLKFKMNELIVLGLVILQFVDILPGLTYKRKEFDYDEVERRYSNNIYCQADWSELFDKASDLKGLDYVFDYQLAAFSLLNGWHVEFPVTSHGMDYVDFDEMFDDNMNELLERDSLGTVFYIANDTDTAQKVLDGRSDVNIYVYEGLWATYYVVVSDEIEIESAIPWDGK